MKKLVCALLVVAMLALTGCTSRTAFGPCIGAFEDESPNLHYKVSVWNTILAIIFFETIVVPIVVIASEAKCPRAMRDK